MNKKEENRFGSVIICGIMSFIFLIVMIVGLVLYMRYSDSTNVETTLPPWSTIKSNNKDASIKLIPILTGSFSLSFNFIGSLLLLCFRWENTWCKENKKLWGLLSMFLVIGLGLIIFFSIGIHKSRKRRRTNYDEFESSSKSKKKSSRYDLNNFVDDY